MKSVPLTIASPAAQPRVTGSWSIPNLVRAPHRLLFFVGASNVLLAMMWWALWLIDARWHVIGMPQPVVPAGWRASVDAGSNLVIERA